MNHDLGHTRAARIRSLIALLLVAVTAAPSGAGAAYPEKPVRLIIGQAAGGPTDLAARALADGLRAALGQPVIVDNRPGAAGQVGLTAIAKAPPDGYTLYLTGSTVVTLRYTNKSYTFDALKDFTLIAQTAVLQLAFMVSRDMAVSTIDELVADLKRNPGKRFYASTGASDILQMQAFARGTDTKFDVIRFNGAGQAFQAMMAGEVHFTSTALGSGLPLADAGKLRVVAVTGHKRSSFAPNVPALSESSNAAIRALGEGLMPSTWYGVIGPPGIAPDIVAAIHSAVERALKDPEYAKVMAKIGFDTVPGSPAEFRAVVARTASAWSEAARAYNFQPE